MGLGSGDLLCMCSEGRICRRSDSQYWSIFGLELLGARVHSPQTPRSIGGLCRDADMPPGSSQGIPSRLVILALRACLIVSYLHLVVHMASCVWELVSVPRGIFLSVLPHVVPPLRCFLLLPHVADLQNPRVRREGTSRYL